MNAAGVETTGGLPAGKIPPAVLERLLSVSRMACPRLLVPPAPGEDAAVLDLPAGPIAVGSDPITFRTPRPGHYAVCINANDIAATGARPEYFTLTVVVPPGTSSDEIVGIAEDAVRTGEGLGIRLIGGHTELSDAVNRPLVSVTMFGSLAGSAPLRTGGARAGDVLVQVNPLAIEGTVILADEHRAELTALLGPDKLAFAGRLATDPGICVVEPALRAARVQGVHALHDPTEGGIATGIREMATASGLGVVVHRAELIMLEISEEICRCLGVDPLGLISSGCLVCAVDPSALSVLCTQLAAAGYEARSIGEFTEDGKCLLLPETGKEEDLPDFAVDELA